MAGSCNYVKILGKCELNLTVHLDVIRLQSEFVKFDKFSGNGRESNLGCGVTTIPSQCRCVAFAVL